MDFLKIGLLESINENQYSTYLIILFDKFKKYNIN